MRRLRQGERWPWLAPAAFATGALAASYAPQTVIWVGALAIALTGAQCNIRTDGAFNRNDGLTATLADDT